MLNPKYYHFHKGNPFSTFETYINGLLEPESPNFDPDHAFLSSIEAEIITFLPKKAAIWFIGLSAR